MVVNLCEEGEARPPALLHDSYDTCPIDFEGHGCAGSE
jgi:hypothetical protein